MKRIVIKTQVSEMIGASHPARDDHGVATYGDYPFGPRGLLQAARDLKGHARQMTMELGNRGHVRSWIDVNGDEVDELSASCIETLNDARETLCFARGREVQHD